MPKKQTTPSKADRLAIKPAIEKVRAAIAEASEGMHGSVYDAFIDELLADAEGWKMERQERQAEDDIPMGD